MTRRIISSSDIQVLRAKQVPPSSADELALLEASVAGGEAKADDYATKLLKLIPGDVVAVFLTVDGIIHATKDQVPRGVYWGIFVLLAVATFFYIQRSTRTPDLPARPVQSIVSAISFCVWVFAIGGPFTYPVRPGWDLPVYSALLLPLYTFMVPILFQKS